MFLYVILISQFLALFMMPFLFYIYIYIFVKLSYLILNIQAIYGSNVELESFPTLTLFLQSIGDIFSNKFGIGNLFLILSYIILFVLTLLLERGKEPSDNNLTRE